ncbi:TonB-dependent receptor [Sphingobacterium shayense]|uniref:TonB-dependent receptor plug domain-containing protein n=1 Tax=Sphingobacterium shayense TaxID=626343 RepID=UPI00155267B3|nr:TonB-dependent receptor plug domain-containing protein [Sphingobacterium shayense]NQD69904.1 TonB-dependent receptor [Sphingobacterium shayense]
MFNNSKCVLLVALFFVVCQLGYAQQYILEGTVLGNNNEPIASAVVQVDGQPVFAGTDGVYHTEKIDKSKVKVSVKMVGYNVFSQEVALNQGVNKFDIGLVQQQRDIEEVQVTGLTKVQEINRQAFTVSAIDATKLHNTTLNLSDALDRVSGVRVRETGGLGSNMNLSLNGFSGNHVRFFIDGIPMDNMGSSFQINNIPVNLAERIEVYKGVVPIWLGSDALGGAINIVTGSRSRNYVDVSYSYGSFNTHRTVVNAAATTKKGFTFQLNAYQNYSDNNYRVYLEPHNNRLENYSKSIEVPRFHDTYHNETIIASLGVVDKPYADRLLFGITLGQNYKEIQTGARMESVFGGWHRRGNLVMPTLKYSKENLVEGLDVTLNANFNLGTEQNIDTVNRRYDWFGDTGAELPATSGERGAKTMYKYRNNEGLVTANFNYSIGENQTITVNNVFNTFNRKGEDPLNPLNNDYERAKISRKNVLGLGYQYQVSDLWSISVFGKFLSQNNQNGDDASSISNRLGWGTAGTYFLSPRLQVKGSYELTNRMATPYEIFGDVENQDSNPSLKPERSNNFNLGMSYNIPIDEMQDLDITAGVLYRYAKDFIYQRLNQNQSKYIADNRDGVRTVGGDLDLRYHYGTWLNAGTSWTYQYLQNMQQIEVGYTGISPVYKDQMPNIPYLFGNADVQVRFDDLAGKNNALSVGYNMQYIHDFYLYWPSRGNIKNGIPSQLSHDVNILFALADGRYNIGLEARNVTNDRLYDNFSLQRPGRAFYLNLRYYINKK